MSERPTVAVSASFVEVGDVLADGAIVIAIEPVAPFDLNLGIFLTEGFILAGRLSPVEIVKRGATLRTLHRNELGIDYDYRRARGTVVIGHPDHVKLPDVTRDQIERTLRAYNAQLTRVQVVTYAELLAAADRALKFEAESSTR